jgi:hypothetical protein
MTKLPGLPCHTCQHRREIARNCHIACAKPCPQVRGHPHGIANGWFFYPILFDPIWGEGCTNYEAVPAKETP